MTYLFFVKPVWGKIVSGIIVLMITSLILNCQEKTLIPPEYSPYNIKLTTDKVVYHYPEGDSLIIVTIKNLSPISQIMSPDPLAYVEQQHHDQWEIIWEINSGNSEPTILEYVIFSGETHVDTISLNRLISDSIFTASINICRLNYLIYQGWELSRLIPEKHRITNSFVIELN